MRSYNTIRDKFRVISNKINDNSAEITLKENDIKKFFKEESNLYLSQQIYDSGWVSYKPINPTYNIKTTVKGAILPEFVNYDFDINIKVPEQYLPFISFEKTIRTNTDSYVSALSNLESSYYTSNPYVYIYGDVNTLIYKGPAQESIAYQSLEGYINGWFPLNHTKEWWSGDIEWTEVSSGDEYKINGYIGDVFFNYDRSVGCGGTMEETNDLITQFAPGDEHQSKIQTINTSSCTGVGRRQIVTSVTNPTPPPACDYEVTTTYGDVVSQSWPPYSAVVTDDFSTLTITSGTLYKKIGDTWTAQGMGAVIDSRIHNVTNRVFSHIGYYVFYSTQTRKLISLAKDFAPGTNRLTGFISTTTASSYQKGPNSSGVRATDNNDSSSWISNNNEDDVDNEGDYPQWIKFRVNTGRAFTRCKLKPYSNSLGNTVKNFTIEGSINNSTWVSLYSGQHGDNADYEIFDFINTTQYGWYKITFTSGWTKPDLDDEENLDYKEVGVASVEMTGDEQVDWIRLGNLPNVANAPLPYTSMHVLYNYDDSDEVNRTVTTLQKAHEQLGEGRLENRRETFLRLDSTVMHIPTYKVRPKITEIINAKATKIYDNSLILNEYNNVWTQDSGSYAETIKRLTNKVLKEYVTEHTDVEIRLRIVLLNPFFNKNQERAYNQ